MEKHVVSNILKAHNLIPGNISREILRLIIGGQSFNEALYGDFISLEKFLYLQNIYLKEKKTLRNSTAYNPKYLLFYKLIQNKYPNIGWEITPSLSGKLLVKLDLPRVNNIRPSLLSLLLDKVPHDIRSLPDKKYTLVSKLSKFAIKALSTFMSRVDALYPSEKGMQSIMDWLSLCIESKKSTIFLPICPDYSAEPINDSRYRFKHDFKNLGSGIGLIGSRLLEALPHLNELCNQLNIQPKIISGIADFEGFIENNWKRLNITEEEFINRVSNSRLVFEEKAKIPTILISEFFGKQEWLNVCHQIKENFDVGKFGACNIDSAVLLNIAKKRKALYSRWYGKKEALEEYIPLVLEQGIDYATMGFFIGKYLENCLVLGADNNVMAPFYSYSKWVPTLYLKRYYC